MNITVTKRMSQTKGERRQRLRQGFVPGAVYGKGVEPFLVEVSSRSIASVLMAETGLNTMIDLAIDGEKKTHSVLIDNLERDPLTRGFISVGFHQIRKGDKVTVQIPIQLVGMPSDVTLNNAMLEQLLDSITVQAQPSDLPPYLDVDVSHLKTGDVLRVADLPHNPKLEFSIADDQAIASVHVSRVAQDVETSAAEAAAASDAVTEVSTDADTSSDSAA